jgi:Asp-tRNA(Asn)/Glu-tRNA(Gln) amidotransferase A subunit family amidase
MLISHGAGHRQGCADLSAPGVSRIHRHSNTDVTVLDRVVQRLDRVMYRQPINTARRRFLRKAGALLGAATIVPEIAPAAAPAVARSTAAMVELSAVEAIAAMRSGELRAETYANALLDRAGRLAQLNAFRTLHPDEVRAAAREADRRRSASRPLGRLHGLLLPVKDSVDTRALPTSNGTRALEDFRPRADAAVLTPLFAQGAILMGKTNLHELSCGWTSNNATFGPVLNPYDLTRTPGGSSGGSAAAVAARIAPLAIGEDTYGSIRVPATFCGIVGLRPTYGHYPDLGLMPLAHEKFDQVGPLARSVGDLIMFDSVVTGATATISPRPLKGVRIGISPGFLEAGIDPECGRIVEEARSRLSKAGAETVTAELPGLLREASDVERTILGYELLSSIAGFLKAQGAEVTLDEVISQVGPSLVSLFQASRHPGPPEAYRAALRRREQIMSAATAYFREFRIEALAFPPALMPAFPQGDPAAVDIAGRLVNLSTAIGRNIALGSCAGLACLVLPVGLTAAGLPVGLEFDAPPGSDRRLLALGLSLERVLGPVPAPRLESAAMARGMS